MKERTPKTQKDKFIETARALGCDESEAAFNAKLKKMTQTKKSIKAKKKKS